MSSRVSRGGGPWQRLGKPVLDRVAALIGLLATAPLLLALAIAIRRTSAGPALFRQVRAGRDGVPFTALKFRTMTVGEHDPTVQTLDRSPGVTPIGTWLRRFKLDELPQLFNVLAGQMSLIGPRPTLPMQVEEYDDFQRRRLSVRPGLTGLAQVNGNAAISWDQRIEYDVYYSDHVTLAFDLGILWKTVAVALRGERHFARPFAESPYAAEGSEATDPRTGEGAP